MKRGGVEEKRKRTRIRRNISHKIGTKKKKKKVR